MSWSGGVKCGVRQFDSRVRPKDAPITPDPRDVQRTPALPTFLQLFLQLRSNFLHENRCAFVQNCFPPFVPNCGSISGRRLIHRFGKLL